MAAANTPDVPMVPKLVRMAPDTWAALEAESARTGQSVSDLVREGAALLLAFKAAVRAGRDLDDLLPAILESLGRER